MVVIILLISLNVPIMPLSPLLSDAQLGFRRGRYTERALTQFSENMNRSLDQGHQIMAPFIHYKKAFDTLDHEVLLQAMDECGVRGLANK